MVVGLRGMAELQLCVAESETKTPHSGLAKAKSPANASSLPRQAGR